MTTMRTALKRFIRDDRGSIALEYMLTGAVSGGATIISGNLLKDGLSQLAERSQNNLDIMIQNLS